VSIGKLKEVHAKAHPAKAYRSVVLPHEEAKETKNETDITTGDGRRHE
jgi:hypothetical protein